VAGVLGAALAAVAVTAAPSSAREGGPPAAPSGTASATAIVARVTPGVGSLPTGVFGGVAITEVTNKVAQAQAETLDLGLIGVLMNALDLLPSDQQPQPLQVDNRGGPREASADEVPIAGSTLGLGRKAVSATDAPAAHASSELVGSFGGVVSLSAGRAESRSQVDPGRGRRAVASVSVDLDLLGLVRLSGLRWEAVHATGEGNRATGSFSVREATIGGIEVPTGSLPAVEEAVNAALTPLGLSVSLPRVQHSAAGDDLVRITPLQIALRDSMAARAALGPVLGLTREQREELVARLSAESSSAGALLLAADVATSIISGSGFLSIEIGGAQASSAATTEPPPLSGGADLGTGVSGGPLPTLRPPASAPPTAPGPADPGRAVELGEACRSAHEERPRRCSDGALAPAAIAGIAVVAAAAGAELHHQRRRRAVALERGTWRRTARGYGVVGASALALLVAAVVVDVPRSRTRYQGAMRAPEVGAPATGGAPASLVGSGGPGGGSGSTSGGRGGVTPCADRARQVPEDPYSPPCFAFEGDNGGATSRGVTRDAIHVSVREVTNGSATDIFASLGGQGIDASSASVEDTLDALAEYFTTHFQLYGRRIEIHRFQGAGDGITELLGGGKEAALADALVSAKEIGAFADISAQTIPYSDALSRNGVVNIGSPYPSRRWFEQRRPYAWSQFPDGTNVVSATSSAMIGRFPPGSRAEHAGRGLRDRPRRFAILAPENPEYQESIEVLIDKLRTARIDVAMNQKYKLDLVSFPNQASDIVAELKDAGITSVLCLCDPAMAAFGLTPKAEEQSYEPEWITAGLVFVDQDVVAQTIDRRQWQRAFGTAYNAEVERIRGSFPYFAYKSVRPDDEPVRGVEELYYEMYLLVLGIQMAGPNLTPETFQQGMFAYPPAFGPRGTWDFGPGDYTPANDYREIWWDPDRISAQDDRPGAWVQLDGGRRWSPERPPRGRAPFFEEG
jgi:hypothetical protein